MYQIADLIDDQSMINVATWLQNYYQLNQLDQ